MFLYRERLGKLFGQRSRVLIRFEVRFKEGCSRILDSRGDLVCQITPRDRIFLVDFSGTPLGPSRCLLAGPSSDMWKWHRRLGHLSFEIGRAHV